MTLSPTQLAPVIERLAEKLHDAYQKALSNDDMKIPWDRLLESRKARWRDVAVESLIESLTAVKEIEAIRRDLSSAA